MKKINSKSITINTSADSEILRSYFSEVRKKQKNYTKEDEERLFSEYQKTKSLQLREEISYGYLRYVITVAKKYANHNNNLIDLINAGNIGVLIAIDRFDLSKNVKFITFATNYIQLEITTSIFNDSKLIKHNPIFHSINKNYLKLRDKFFNENGYDELPENIIEKIDEKKLKKVKNKKIIKNALLTIHSDNYTSLSMPLGEGSDDTVESILPSNSNEEELTDYINNKIDLSILTKLEKIIISYKFGINNYPELSNLKISEILNLKETDINNILEKSFKKLKNAL
jgi:RNA polymerase primary sigma factor